MGNVLSLILKIIQMTTTLMGDYFSLNVVFQFLVYNCGYILEWFNNVECSVRALSKCRKNPGGW